MPSDLLQRLEEYGGVIHIDVQRTARGEVDDAEQHKGNAEEQGNRPEKPTDE